MPWRLRVVRPAASEAAADAASHGTARLEVTGYLEVAAVQAVLASLSRLVAEQAVVVLACDVAGLARADVCTVDALARLQIGARRLGCPLVLCGVGADLRALIAFVGLTEELPELRADADR